MEFPERFAIRLAGIIAAMVFLLGAYLNAGHANPGWIEAGIEIWWDVCRVTIFPLWFVMRIGAFIFRFTARTSKTARTTT